MRAFGRPFSCVCVLPSVFIGTMQNEIISLFITYVIHCCVEHPLVLQKKGNIDKKFDGFFNEHSKTTIKKTVTVTVYVPCTTNCDFNHNPPISDNDEIIIMHQ